MRRGNISASQSLISTDRTVQVVGFARGLRMRRSLGHKDPLRMRATNKFSLSFCTVGSDS